MENVTTPVSVSALVKAYTVSFDLLDRFDRDALIVAATTAFDAVPISLDEARAAVRELRAELFGNKEAGFFGNEKDQSLESVLWTIYQTFSGVELYPSVEEKAATLLYLTVKNHPFVDGNKRIGSFLFVWFMHRHGILYRADGTQRLAPNALVALTLLIARSDPKEKELIVNLTVNLINQINV